MLARTARELQNLLHLQTAHFVKTQVNPSVNFEVIVWYVIRFKNRLNKQWIIQEH
jgi:hypothetical protein